MPAGDNRRCRIDVHHHCVPPAWVAWAESRGLVDRSQLPWWAHWEVGPTLSMMDSAGIATAVMSVTTPVTTPYTDDAQRRESLRVAYQAVVDLIAAHPGRFAFLAQARLDDLGFAIWSVRYGLRAGAVGAQLPTRDGQARYLGNPVFDPLLAELDDWSTVAVLHPTDVPGTSDEQPALPGVPNFLCDYALETTRASVNMTVHRVLDRFPRLSFVLPHGGGFLPYLSARFELTGESTDPPVDAALVREYTRRFHYDTAAPMSPSSTPTLLATAGAARLLYGSDWPPMTLDQVLRAAAALDGDPALTGAHRAAINRDNALALFPALACT